MFSMFFPHLGGMHMMMTFVGAVGTLMRGSGLEEILKSTFAGVPKLLSGKKFPQNVRALCIVTEELLRPTLDNQELHSTKDLTNIWLQKAKRVTLSKLWVDCLIQAGTNHDEVCLGRKGRGLATPFVGCGRYVAIFLCI